MKTNRIRFNINYFIITLVLFVGSLQAQWQNLPSETGTNGMVSTAHPLASEAALDVLKNGGNAIDAAVAAAFAIGVVEPDGSGLGGGGCMLVYLEKEKKTFYINFYQKASEKIEEVDWNRDEGDCAKLVLIPGNVAGLTTALENFGTMELKDVIKYAISYAENGFPVDNTLATILLDNYPLLEKNDETKEAFLPTGFPLMEGETLVQKNLAQTLRTISEQGAKGFYEGEIAKRISENVTDNGGRITLNDLKNYKAEIGEPLKGYYRGYEVLTANVPQSGIALIETLNMFEFINFKKLGHYTESPMALHLMAETLLRSYADRYYYVGDPKFSDIPINGLASKVYAFNRFQDIDFFSTNETGYRKTEAGDPFEYNVASTEYSETDSEKSGHTTHLSVVDRDGNMVALTQTLGTFFGSGFSVGGIIFNDSYTNYSSNVDANKLEPNKTPRSTISPTFLLKDGEPFLAIGTPGGGRIIAALAEIIVNVVDFGMSAESANQAPRFYCQVNDSYLNLENRISEPIREALIGKGHELKIHGDFDLFFGGAQFIIVDKENGKLYGTADARRGGVAMGY